jgi:hypothetical protein
MHLMCGAFQAQRATSVSMRVSSLARIADHFQVRHTDVASFSRVFFVALFGLAFLLVGRFCPKCPCGS